MNFCTRKKVLNCIFGSFKLFSGAKIDFLPFLKFQKMCFCTFEIAFFSSFRALCNYYLYRLEEFFTVSRILQLHTTTTTTMTY